nr:MarR family transcriptional regulator [Anoxybacillus sp. UARK-01]
MQFHILESLLHAKADISMTELADGLRISKQQLTQLIRNLEEKEYVTKVPSPTDKRSVIVMLTEKGRHVVKKR